VTLILICYMYEKSDEWVHNINMHEVKSGCLSAFLFGVNEDRRKWAPLETRGLVFLWSRKRT